MSAPNNAKMSDKLKLPTNNQWTSWGENEKVRYKTLAQTYSKNGFQIQIKGVSPTCLLSGLEIVQPIQVRWRRHNATAHDAPLIMPNLYADISDVQAQAAANAFQPVGLTNTFMFDSVQIRPNGFMRSARSCTISYNGRSFSTRCNQYISGVERLFCDGGMEDVYGWPYATYPFSNLAHPSRLLREPGRFDRAKELTSDAYLGAAHYLGNNRLDDCFFNYNIRSKLWFGPFIADAFPEMMKSLDNNTAGSKCYLSNLTIEVQYEDNPLIHWFAYPGNDVSNRLGCDNPYTTLARNAALASDDAGTFVPDLALMWKNVYQGALDIQKDADIGNVKMARSVGLLQPYCTYTFVEQNPMLVVPQQVPIASKSFVCYEDIQQIGGGATGAKEASFSFSNIKLNQISQLYMVYVEAADSDSGAGASTCIGARQPKWLNQAAVSVQKLGGAYSVLFAPIDWSSVRVLLSTKNQVLGNFSGDKLGISERSQYETFKKYSGNRCKMSLAQWRASSQMILFSASDLNLDVFSGMHDPLSLTISFRARRLATDDGVSTLQFGSVGSDVLGINLPSTTTYVNLVARLVMVQQEEIVLFDGGCEKKSVFWPPEVARRAAQSSLGRRETVADGPPQGALANFR